MNDSNEIFEYIDYYLSLGMSLIPIVPYTKQPAVSWKQFQIIPAARDVVYKWFSNEFRGYNIAAVMGVNNIIGIDFDDPSVFFKLLPSDERNGMLVNVTGRGGVHVIFRVSNPILTYRIPELKLEVHGKGSILVLPPSIHANGNQYQIINKPTILREVHDFSTWFSKLLKDRLGFSLNPHGLTHPSDKMISYSRNNKGYKGPDPGCIVKILNEGFEETFRNCGIMLIGGYWAHVRKWPREEVEDKILIFNENSNRPPLDEREVLRCVDSLYRGGYNYGCRSLQAWCDEESKRNCPLKERKRKILRKIKMAYYTALGGWS